MMKLLLLLVVIFSLVGPAELFFSRKRVNKCRFRGLLRDPKNPNRYRQCVNGKLISRPCAPGTIFVARRRKCLAVRPTRPTSNNKESMDFYVDGKLKLSKERAWFGSNTVTFPDTTIVLAIKFYDACAIGGLKLNYNNGRQTGAWKCSDKYKYGWTAWNFDENLWDELNVQTHSRSIDNGNVKQWIWTTKVPKRSKDALLEKIWNKKNKPNGTIYCRKQLNPVLCDVNKSRLVKDRTNCRAFKQCNNTGKYVTKICAPGTGFNEVIQTCVHLANLRNCS